MPPKRRARKVPPAAEQRDAESAFHMLPGASPGASDVLAESLVPRSTQERTSLRQQRCAAGAAQSKGMVDNDGVRVLLAQQLHRIVGQSAPLLVLIYRDRRNAVISEVVAVCTLSAKPAFLFFLPEAQSPIVSCRSELPKWMHGAVRFSCFEIFAFLDENHSGLFTSYLSASFRVSKRPNTFHISASPRSPLCGADDVALCCIIQCSKKFAPSVMFRNA